MGGDALEDLDGFEGEAILAAVVELEEADDAVLRADGQQGQGSIAVAGAAVVRQGVRLFPRRRRREQLAGIVRPATAAGRGKRAERAGAVRQDEAAGASQARMAHGVRAGLALRVANDQIVFRGQEVAGEALLDRIGEVVAHLEADAHRVEAGGFLEHGDQALEQVVQVFGLVEELEGPHAHFAVGFGALGLGDVDVGAHDHGGGAAVFAPQRPPAREDPHPVAVGVAHAEGVLIDALGMLHVFDEIPLAALLVVGVDQVQPDLFDVGLLGGEAEVGGLAAEHGEVFGAGPHVGRVVVVLPRAGVRGADQGLVALRRFLVLPRQGRQGALGALALGDVLVRPLVAAQASVRVQDGHPVGGDPDDLPRGREHWIDEIQKRLPPGEGREGGFLERRAALFGMEVVEVHFPDQVLGGIAEDFFRDGAEVGIEPGGVGFPGDGAAVPGEQVVAAHAAGQIEGPLVHQPLHVLAPMRDEGDHEGAGEGDGKAGQQGDPGEVERVVGHEFRRGPDGDGIGPAKRQDGARKGPGARQGHRRIKRDSRRGDRGDPLGRGVGAQLQQVQGREAVFLQIFAEEGFEEDLRVHRRHDESAEGLAFARLVDRPEDEDLRSLAGGARQGGEDVGGGNQAGLRSRFQGGPDGVDGAQIAAGVDAVWHEGFGRADVIDGIVDFPGGGGDRGSRRIGLPDPVVLPLPARLADRLLEGVFFPVPDDGHPGPGQHFRNPDQMPGIAPEFVGRHPFAAFDEPGEAFDFRVPEREEGIEDAPGLDVGQRGEGFLLVADLDEVGEPDRRQGQGQPGGGDRRGFQVPPAARDLAVGFLLPASQPVGERQDDEQRHGEQAGGEAGAGRQRAPVARVDVDAHHGDQPAGLGVDQRDERADPHAPAVRDRAFGGGDARSEHGLED